MSRTRDRPPSRRQAPGRRGSGTSTKETTARERILRAAEELFASHGYDATTTKAIARAAQVPSGLVFYYFPTKIALLHALLAERTILPRVREAVEAVSGSDLKEALTQIGTRMLAVYRSRVEMLRILLRESLVHPEAADQFARLRAEAVELLSASVRRSIETGRLRAVDPEVFVRLFIAGLLFAALVEPPDDPDAYVRRLVDTLVP